MKKTFVGLVAIFFILISTCVFASVADGVREPLSPFVKWTIVTVVFLITVLFAVVGNAAFFYQNKNDDSK